MFRHEEHRTTMLQTTLRPNKGLKGNLPFYFTHFSPGDIAVSYYLLNTSYKLILYK